MSDRIQKTILLRAPKKRVWQALSDSAEFGDWFGVKFNNPFTPGTRMLGTVVPTKVKAEIAGHQQPYEGLPFEMVIDQMEPERLFSFRWHPFAIEPATDYSAEPMTLVAFTLEEVADGVLLTVTESGFDQIPLERRLKAFTANEGGWTMVVQLIEAHLALTP
jgi:uncharacterized protein YndB with AHSA1/START domain